MIVYLAGKYSGKVGWNIALAKEIAVGLWDKGYTVICPHANTGGFEDICEVAQYKDFMIGCLEILSVCDAVVFMPQWEDSIGATIEYKYCIENMIPFYFYPNLPTNVKNEYVAKFLIKESK